MARILSVAQLGHPIIRRKAQVITDFTDPALIELIEDMMVTVADEGGMGIAAPQVYQSKRLVILCSKPNSRYPHAPLMPPTAMINPKILRRSEQMENGWEGCLTIPGVRGLVPRHCRIEIEYQQRDGTPANAVYEDFLARLFQHEVDHLDGVVFLDRVTDPTQIMMEKEWQRRLAAGELP